MKNMERSWGAVVFRSSVFPPGQGEARHQYLLVQHVHGGHWGHPKGHAEKGENPEETARREIREEGAIHARIIPHFSASVRWIVPTVGPKIVCYFLAEYQDTCPPEGPMGEIKESIWLPFEEALERLTYKNDQKVLKKAAHFLKKTL